MSYIQRHELHTTPWPWGPLDAPLGATSPRMSDVRPPEYGPSYYPTDTDNATFFLSSYRTDIASFSPAPVAKSILACVAMSSPTDAATPPTSRRRRVAFS